MFAPHNERLYKFLGYRIPEWETVSDPLPHTTNGGTASAAGSTALLPVISGNSDEVVLSSATTTRPADADGGLAQIREEGVPSNYSSISEHADKSTIST